MKFRALILPTISICLVAAPALANWVALDGNRNPFSFLGLNIGGVQEQQVSPSDTNGVPFGPTNPQYFNLLLNGSTLNLGQTTKAFSLPTAPPTDPDVRPNAATITATDTASSTVTGQNGASIVTGSPTANSFVTQAVNGSSTARLQLSGSWVGTLLFEQSIDGGTTFGAMGCHVNGTAYSTSSITGNGIFDCEAAGATQIRVRATSFVGGGTAVLTETITSFAGVVKILNSVALKDNASGAALTIKPASTAPQATDPAAVVALSPNTGEVGTPATSVSQPAGGIGLSGWLSGIFNKLNGTLTTSDGGTAGSGISQPAGGAGVSGWLSGIYKALTGTLNTSASQSGTWNVTPLGITSTDAGGTITVGGSYQTAIAASGTRKGCQIQNPTTATEALNVKFGTMANPFTLLAGMSIGCNQGGLVLQDAVTVMGATTGHAFAALAQ